MTFHPDKCKVLSVSLEHEIHYQDSGLPFNTFHYCLNPARELSTTLSFVESEKDLGLIVSYNLSSALQSVAIAQLHNKSNSLYFYLLLILQIKVGLENKQILLCKL